MEKVDIRTKLVEIRTILDLDIPKGKQRLTNLIKDLKGEINSEYGWVKKE